MVEVIECCNMHFASIVLLNVDDCLIVVWCCMSISKLVLCLYILHSASYFLTTAILLVCCCLNVDI